MKLLNVNQASNKLNVSPATLYKWAHLRRIPFVKLGSRLLFDESALDEMIQELTTKPAAK